jgi:phosphatidylglycerol:prolipoprotein diacylglycerol transferase
MYPILGYIGDTPIVSYYVLNSIAIITGFIVLFLNIKNFEPAKRNRTLLFAFFIFIPFVLGARFGSMIEGYIHHTPQCVSKNFFSGPSSLWWGLCASVILALPFIRLFKIDLWETGDIFALCISIGGVFARLACLFNGCCFGLPAPKDYPFAVFYPFGSRPFELFGGVPMYPPQLFESLAWLFIFVLLLARKKTKTFNGELMLFLGFLYACARFIIEFYRYHETYVFPSPAQIFSIIIVISSAIIWIIKKKHILK